MRLPSLKEWIERNVPLELRDQAANIFSPDKYIQVEYIHAAYELGQQSKTFELDKLRAEVEGLKQALQDKVQITQNVVVKKGWWSK